MFQNKPYKCAVTAAFMSLVIISAQVSAAGFDCSKASHADEKAVCASRLLSEKDIQMTTTYKLLGELLLMGARGALHDEQTQWLEKRRQCGANNTCLSQLYDQRNQALTQEYSNAARIVNAN